VSRAVGPFTRLVVVLFGLLAAGVPAFACPSCFSQAQGPLVDAARLGMWLLLAVTLSLQGAFVIFFLYLRRQAAKAASAALDEEWSGRARAWDRQEAL
jgi:uncharacterized membrane protein